MDWHSPGNTERLTIEPLTVAHARALLPVLDDERIYRFVPTQRRTVLGDLEVHFARLERGPAPPSPERWLNWALKHRASGVYLGTLQATLSGEGSAQIGYLLNPSVWGNGYASEACRWLLSRLGATREISAVYASVDHRNPASIRLLKGLGFEHVSSEPCELHGQMSLDHHFSITIEP